jgi:hypothetical protein
LRVNCRHMRTPDATELACVSRKAKPPEIGIVAGAASERFSAVALVIFMRERTGTRK